MQVQSHPVPPVPRATEKRMIIHYSNYCTVLYCTVLYCTVLYCTVLYYTILYCIVMYCNVPQSTLRCSVTLIRPSLPPSIAELLFDPIFYWVKQQVVDNGWEDAVDQDISHYGDNPHYDLDKLHDQSAKARILRQITKCVFVICLKMRLSQCVSLDNM